MRTALLLCLFAAMLGCGKSKPDPVTDPVPPPVEWSANLQTIADGQNQFAFDLYGKLAASEKGNLFVSPYSIHAALAMTATGAKSTTRDEMVKVLHLPTDESKLLAAGDLGRYYDHPRKDYELAVANALWGQQGFPWRAEWMDMQKTRFGAGFHEVDYKMNREAARARINGWVAEKTRDKIRDLLKPDDVNQRTRMVLTNAIYFKGRWTEEFDKRMTREQPFHLADGGKVQVPLMNHTLYCGYAENETFQILEMSYKGAELSFVVLLPRKADGLAALEKQVTLANLAPWLKNAGLVEVNVTLPRFKLEQRFEPARQLKTLGLSTAFDPEIADFSGMATEPLFISKVVHQSFLDVNEEGTEAAAATAVVMEKLESAPPPPNSFRADRPFLFLIRDAKRGTILFMGRMMNPKT